MKHICTHCHYADDSGPIIERDGWTIDAFTGAAFRGRPVKRLRGRTLTLLFTLATRDVSVTSQELRRILSIGVGGSGRSPAMFANALDYEIRKLGIPSPVKVIGDGQAYAWAK